MKSRAFFAKLKKTLRKETSQRVIGIIAISVLFICATYAIYSDPTPKISPKIAFTLSLVSYILSEILFVLVLRFIHLRFLSKSDSPLFSSEFFSSMANSINAPIALITSKGYILWYAQTCIYPFKTVFKLRKYFCGRFARSSLKRCEVRGRRSSLYSIGKILLYRKIPYNLCNMDKQFGA